MAILNLAFQQIQSWLCGHIQINKEPKFQSRGERQVLVREKKGSSRAILLHQTKPLTLDLSTSHTYSSYGMKPFTIQQRVWLWMGT
jgi:hypothetical protein